MMDDKTETLNDYIKLLDQIARRQNKASPFGSCFWLEDNADEDTDERLKTWRCYLCERAHLLSKEVDEHVMFHMKELNLLPFV